MTRAEILRTCDDPLATDPWDGDHPPTRQIHAEDLDACHLLVHAAFEAAMPPREERIRLDNSDLLGRPDSRSSSCAARRAAPFEERDIHDDATVVPWD